MSTHTVKLISVTQPTDGGSAEALIAYCARVSNPANQDNSETAPRLLAYLIKHKHWSPFEMVNMCVEVNTTRAISAQILRHQHRAQEFSARYSEVSEPACPELRYAGSTNRQSSSEPFLRDDPAYNIAQQAIWYAHQAYEKLLQAGVARECARMILPMCSPTRLYLNNSVRGWIHYLQVRTDEHTQKEHRAIAEEIKTIFTQQFPATSKALAWTS